MRGAGWLDERIGRVAVDGVDVIQWERTLAPTVNNYAATGDCGRFLVATRPPNAQVLPIHVVVNWPALLAR